MSAHFSRALLVMAFATFICLLYPEYVMVADVYEYIGESDNDSLSSWESIMAVEASDIEISSKLFSSKKRKMSRAS